MKPSLGNERLGSVFSTAAWQLLTTTDIGLTIYPNANSGPERSCCCGYGCGSQGLSGLEAFEEVDEDEGPHDIFGGGDDETTSSSQVEQVLGTARCLRQQAEVAEAGLG